MLRSDTAFSREITVLRSDTAFSHEIAVLKSNTAFSREIAVIKSSLHFSTKMLCCGPTQRFCTTQHSYCNISCTKRAEGQPWGGPYKASQPLTPIQPPLLTVLHTASMSPHCLPHTTPIALVTTSPQLTPKRPPPTFISPHTAFTRQYNASNSHNQPSLAPCSLQWLL